MVGLGHENPLAGKLEDWGIQASFLGRISVDSLKQAASQSGEPQVIFHAAGGSVVGASWQNPSTDFANTVLTTQAVIEATASFSKPPLIIYPSSAAVYGGQHSDKIAETVATRPISPYGVHKLASEELLKGAQRMYGVQCVIIRYFSLYGPELRKQLLWDISRRILDGERPLSLGGNGTETRDFLYATDAARLAYFVLDHAGEQPLIINGASGTGTEIRDLAGSLVAALGAEAEIVFTGEKRIGDPDHLIGDTQRLAELGFQAEHSLESSLQEYAAWAINAIQHGLTASGRLGVG